MTDRVSTYQIGFSGDATDLQSFLANLKSSFKSAAADIQNSTSKLNAFSGLQSDLQKSISAFVSARAAAADFREQIAAIEAAGGTVGKDLTTGLANAEKAATSATK